MELSTIYLCIPQNLQHFYTAKKPNLGVENHLLVID
jgi:hypothetical protein